MSDRSEPLKRDKHYPLADRPFKLIHRRDVFAVWTGEKRPPRKGEWYLSGAIIEAYRAKNDLSSPFHIAKLVTVTETKTYHVADFKEAV